MSGAGFAGRLRQRVTLLRRANDRDDLGGASGGWVLLRSAWAAIVPEDRGAVVEGTALSALPRWRVTLRSEGAAVAIGDRLDWGARRLRVRGVTQDPERPDRVMLSTEEER